MALRKIESDNLIYERMDNDDLRLSDADGNEIIVVQYPVIGEFILALEGLFPEA